MGPSVKPKPVPIVPVRRLWERRALLLFNSCKLWVKRESASFPILWSMAAEKMAVVVWSRRY